MQYHIRGQLILDNKLPKKINLVAGADQAFINDEIISAIVVCKYENMKIIEKQYSITKTNFPYVPGFLFFREGPAIIKTFNKLNNKPDVLIIDGNGILHPRNVGLASHVGFVLKTPTIGVAKSLLVREYEEPKLNEHKPVVYRNNILGFALRTKEKPIFISPGHMISLKTSLKIVKNCLRNHKIPEPIQYADHYSREILNRMKS